MLWSLKKYLYRLHWLQNFRLNENFHMKTHQAWKTGMSNGHAMTVTRSRPATKRPLWIIILLSLFCVSLIGAYIYPPRGFTPCYLLTSRVCGPFKDWLPPSPAREWTDAELNSRAVFNEILSVRPIQPKNPKIAFMFLTPGSLPFEKLWEKFFQGHDDLFSIYIHASKEKPVHTSSLFVDKEIRSDKVVWGKISMVDAERRLLANALQDSDNQHFILLSDSCAPVHNFDYVYRYLMETNVSFVDCFEDPGPHGSGRYDSHMMPEIERKDFRKGAQWFSVKRQHALLILADNLYYNKFKNHCKPGMDGRNCYSDEHYLPTFFNMVDPTGIANWSITHVDWSEAKWHPKAYRAPDVTFELLKNITSIDESTHVTSDKERVVTQRPCMWNGVKRPCYLFARKFYPEALGNLTNLFLDYIVT